MKRLTTKKCSRCGIPKLRSDFYRNKRNKDGFTCSCKTCIKKYNDSPEVKARKKKIDREYQKTPKDKARRRTYQKTTKSKAARKVYRERPEIKLALKNSSFKRKYGITLVKRKLMYANQNGCCEICEQLVPYNDIHTDHDHKTGKIRGLLCVKCNHGMHYIDNVKLCEKMMTYREKYLGEML